VDIPALAHRPFSWYTCANSSMKGVGERVGSDPLSIGLWHLRRPHDGTEVQDYLPQLRLHAGLFRPV